MKIRQHTELEVYKKAFDAAMLIFESVEKVSEGGNVFTYRPDAAFFKIRVCEFSRSLAEAPLQGGFHCEVIRRRERSR